MQASPWVVYTNRRRILCTPRVIEAGASQLAVALMHIFGISLKWLETGWKRLLTLCPERIFRHEKDQCILVKTSARHFSPFQAISSWNQRPFQYTSSASQLKSCRLSPQSAIEIGASLLNLQLFLQPRKVNSQVLYNCIIYITRMISYHSSVFIKLYLYKAS